jgi:hypothetical protein
MNPTFRQMEILVAAAEAANFSAAGQSYRTRGWPLLFERTTRPLKLTKEGRRAAAIARELVQDFTAS